MTLRHLFCVPFAIALAACGNNNGPEAPAPASTGTLNATWSWSGTSSPVVKIDLLGATSGISCGSVPSTISGAVQSLANQSPSGSTHFSALVPGSYVVVASAAAADGTPIALACQDQVSVAAGQTADVSLSLQALIPGLAGSWKVSQQLDIGLPIKVQQDLNLVADAIDAVCTLDAGACSPADLAIVTDVTDILTNMTVLSTWQLTPNSDGSYSGTVTWQSIQGLTLPAGTNFVSGTFTAQASGEGAITYQNFALTMNLGDIVVWLVQNELGQSLDGFGPTVGAALDSISGNYVSPLTFTGTGTVTGSANGPATQIAGPLSGSLQVGSWTHGFSTNYTAVPGA